MKITTVLTMCSLLAVLNSCKNEEKNFDATGTFEAEEIIISSEAAGTIKELEIEEGLRLETGQLIGFVDSTQLYLRKKQLLAQREALLSRRPDIAVQLAALDVQLKSALHEQKRISNLVKSEAATAKQLDDINANVEVIKKQIAAQQSVLEISSGGISKDAEPLMLQVEQLNDQLQKCRIVNPVAGTVLSQYVKANEMTIQGKAMYKIADLSTLILRVYVSGDQLATINLNQQVKVFTDDGNGGMRETTGTIIWINDKAEFTPKTIQTKNERANLVYAIKVKVKNDGAYKIGMYGEVKF